MSKIPYNTAKAYRATISVLEKLLGEDFKKIVFKKPELVLNKLKEKYTNVNTLKSYIARILKIYDMAHKTRSKEMEVYENALKNFESKHREEVEKNVKNEKQDENWVSWKEIIRLRKLLSQSADQSFDKFVHFLILCLYTYIPPLRADYGEVRVVHDEPKDDNYNYLVFNEKKPHFIFNQYKTKKTYGVLKIGVPLPLIKILQVWFKKFNKKPKYLLIRENGDMLGDGRLDQLIIWIFKKYLKKKIGVSMLRHIFITDVVNKMTSIENKKVIARVMGHNLLMQMEYTKQ
jgi:hypothetical protein